MKGKILDFKFQSSEGLISAEDGKRYTFTASEWMSSEQNPTKDMEVDFVVENENAVGVYVDSSSRVVLGGKNKIAAGLLAVFLGGLGIHKFYLGCTGTGILMMVIFLFGFSILGIPSAIIGIIAVIEAIVYFTKSDLEFDVIYVKNKKCWF
ncbi:TM2 domain-containing protein [bacterium]|nr:TM2 domain-containing protein [bacterium]MBU1993609.1 TM2 domain-containing protein [bacterium]